jgi:hypothetical protein
MSKSRFDTVNPPLSELPQRAVKCDPNYDPCVDRHWNSEAQRWIYPQELEEALNQAQVAIDTYYREPDNRAWAEQWLLKAYEANQSQKEMK